MSTTKETTPAGKGKQTSFYMNEANQASFDSIPPGFKAPMLNRAWSEFVEKNKSEIDALLSAVGKLKLVQSEEPATEKPAKTAKGS